jgi:hypothetical protein
MASDGSRTLSGTSAYCRMCSTKIGTSSAVPSLGSQRGTPRSTAPSEGVHRAVHSVNQDRPVTEEAVPHVIGVSESTGV